MNMADKDWTDHDLDALLAAAAKDAAQAPSGDLMARVLADAEVMQPTPAAFVPEPAPRRGRLAGIVSALGGWPSLGGLAAATVAGLWIGFSATPVMLPDGLAGLVDDESVQYLAYLDTSYAYFEEDAE